MKLTRREAIKLAQLIYGKQDERVKEIEQAYKQLQTDTIDTINSYISDGKNWNTKAPIDDIRQLLIDVKSLYDDLDDDGQNLVRMAFEDNKLRSNGDLLIAKLTANIVAVSIFQQRHLIASTGDISKVVKSHSFKDAKNLIDRMPDFKGGRRLNHLSGDIDVIMQKMARNAVLDRHIDINIVDSINKQTLDVIRKVRSITEIAAKSPKDSLNWKHDVANVLTGGNKSTDGQMGRAAGMIRTATAQSLNRSMLEDYQKRGVKRYKFMSLEAVTTCQQCNNLDGRIFKVKDAKEGVNYPLIHINCQCFTCEVNESDDWDTSNHDITDKFKELTT